VTDAVERQIASDISVIALALLAVTFVLLSLTWKGFAKRWAKMPVEQRRPLARAGFWMVLPVATPSLMASLVGSYWPELFQATAFLVFMLLGAIATL
jgi:hypothetical protein